MSDFLPTSGKYARSVCVCVGIGEHYAIILMGNLICIDGHLAQSRVGQRQWRCKSFDGLNGWIAAPFIIPINNFC